MKKKLLIYTDCYMFGGSEILITGLVKNSIIYNNFHIVFAYRFHNNYKCSLEKEFSNFDNLVSFCPLPILANDNIFRSIDVAIKIPLIRMIFKRVLNSFDKFGFYFIYNFIVQSLLILRSRPNIIHINNGGYPGASSCSTMVFVSKFFSSAPIIYQINNSTQQTNSIFRKYFDNLVNFFVDNFITASSHSKFLLENYRKFDPEKIILVPNTVHYYHENISREKVLFDLNISNDKFIVCSVGHLFKSKGHSYLLDAFEIIKDINLDIFQNLSLLVIGDGPEEVFLKKNVNDKKLGDNVFFLGHQDNSNKYISCSDLFVFPSISSEDMPLVILAAMSMGKKIIATDFSGIKEQIVHLESGILVSLNTDTLSIDIANSIIKLYNDQGNKFGDNAKLRFESKFSTYQYGIRINDIYSSSVLNKLK